MKYGKAFGGGIMGAMAMSIIMAMARAMGIPVNLEKLLGTLLGGPSSLTMWGMGFFIHLAAGGLFGLVYAVGFDYTAQRANWLVGPVFGVVHGVLSGIFIAQVDVRVVIWLHIFYGAIVGALYGPAVHQALSTRGDTCHGHTPWQGVWPYLLMEWRREPSDRGLPSRAAA
jgi:hypothetical protein